MQPQSKFTPSPNPLDFKIKSIGFQNQIHWILKSNPLDFKTESIGIQNEIHWKLQAIPMDLCLNSSVTDDVYERD